MNVAKSSKKASASKKAPATHPSFKEMIIESIINLKERMGSSRQAIKKYIHTNYKGLKDNADSLINMAIKKGVEKGEFLQPKGPSGPLKLAKKETSKKEPTAPAPAAAAPKEKKAAAPKKPMPSPKKAVASPKKAVAKKAPAKKVAAAKPPAAKKPAARKPAAAKKPAASKKPAAKKAVVKPKPASTSTKPRRAAASK